MHLVATHFADEVGASVSEQNAKHETTEEEVKVRGGGAAGGRCALLRG